MSRNYFPKIIPKWLHGLRLQKHYWKTQFFEMPKSQAQIMIKEEPQLR